MSNPARDLDESRVLEWLPAERRESAAERVTARDLRDSLNACLRDKAKLQRAYGECLGSQRR